MMKDCDWLNQVYCKCFANFTIVEGHGPVAHCGKGLVVALHGICANCPSGKRLIIALHDVRNQCLCGKGLIVIPSPVTILGKEFVVAFFGKRLVVALLDRCVLFGVLAILTPGDVHAVFGILNVLAFGNVHAFGNIHAISSVLAVPNLGVFAFWVIVQQDMVIVASCKRQHITFDCCVEVLLVLPLHLFVIVSAPSNVTMKNDCCSIDIVVVVL
jgi:hypothetical protein